MGTADLRDSYVVGSVMLVRRFAWDLVGGMDDAYFLYGEDAALSAALARRLSGDQVGDLRLPLVHHGNAPVTELPPMQQRHMADGIDRFLRMHGSASAAWIALRLHAFGYLLRAVARALGGRRREAHAYVSAARAAIAPRRSNQPAAGSR